jgi:predicted O-methyltransferase YrrM
VYLDSLVPLSAEVGYGELGRFGSLGYEWRQVSVGGQPFAHALSAHPPSRVVFQLSKQYRRFRCQVALTDEVAAHNARAHFAVIVDGREVASAKNVAAARPPQVLDIDVTDAQQLELVVTTDRWEHSHAVWIDPELKGDAIAEFAFLDDLEPRFASVGYGDIGRRGRLGYEDKLVSVGRRAYNHALSTHAPARLVYPLDGRFRSFTTHVALNDDVPAGASHAHFEVRADGRLVAQATFVGPGEQPRQISADVTDTKDLELVVTTGKWSHCHTVWLDPQLSSMTHNMHTAEPLVDCLGRVAICPPAITPRADRCVATVVSPGFEPLLDDMLGSLRANGEVDDALVAVFVVRPSDEIRRLVTKYDAVLLECEPRSRIDSTLKAVLYSAARIIDARWFLCLDADMLALGDLRPVFATLEALPEGSILACREGNDGYYRNLEHALVSVYGGKSGDIAALLGTPRGEAAYPLVVNDGLFAAGRTAMLNLDGQLRSWPSAPRWVDERRDVWWRNQFVFNLALAQLGCGVELDPVYNVQLNSQDVDLRDEASRMRGLWRGRAARMLHFNGLGRHKHIERRGVYAAVSDPLPRAETSDTYGEFLRTLRAWVGRYGTNALAWSFYGTADGLSANVRDASGFPLFAALYALVRANGCVRVLETGTARGVSAACLAAAVCHRDGGRVVTFDPYEYPERYTLWAALPDGLRACIEPRAVDSVAGMAAAVEAGEAFELALLDSRHDTEHVWAEFQLATQLVCPGGLILIHDACLAREGVLQALGRIAAAGYAVTRLWSAECGVAEDDRLGLALIENTRWPGRAVLE